MILSNPIHYLLIIVSCFAINFAYEICPNTLVVCPQYCCNTQYFQYVCCGNCHYSYKYHKECYARAVFTYPIISGMVLGSVAFLILIFLLVSLFCGCINSQSTKNERYPIAPINKGNVVVMKSQYESVYPQTEHQFGSYSKPTAPPYNMYQAPPNTN